jgi:transglutaminase-like putative cysteine protease
VDPVYLNPTPIIDSHNEKIVKLARAITKGLGGNPVEQSVKLYYWVRDEIRYDPYSPFYLPEHYRASNVLKSGRGFCISKASLLCALGRAAGIPSRVGFATVRSHLATRQLIERMGSDKFRWHGYVEFYLEDRWVKATPAFNAELCKKFRVAALEFDGRTDSIFQEYNSDKEKFMTYTEFYGTFADIPVDAIMSDFRKNYGEDRVAAWIADLENSTGEPPRDFESEDVLT